MAQPSPRVSAPVHRDCGEVQGVGFVAVVLQEVQQLGHDLELEAPRGAAVCARRHPPGRRHRLPARPQRLRAVHKTVAQHLVRGAGDAQRKGRKVCPLRAILKLGQRLLLVVVLLALRAPAGSAERRRGRGGAATRHRSRSGHVLVCTRRRLSVGRPSLRGGGLVVYRQLKLGERALDEHAARGGEEKRGVLCCDARLVVAVHRVSCIAGCGTAV